MCVSEAYWQRAKILSAGRSGKSFVVYESDDPVIRHPAQIAFVKLGLSVDDRNRGHINVFLGESRFKYSFVNLERGSQNNASPTPEPG